MITKHQCTLHQRCFQPGLDRFSQPFPSALHKLRSNAGGDSSEEPSLAFSRTVTFSNAADDDDEPVWPRSTAAADEMPERDDDDDDDDEMDEMRAEELDDVRAEEMEDIREEEEELDMELDGIEMEIEEMEERVEAFDSDELPPAGQCSQCADTFGRCADTRAPGREVARCCPSGTVCLTKNPFYAACATPGRAEWAVTVADWDGNILECGEALF